MPHRNVKILGSPAELSLTGSFQFRAKTKRLWFKFFTSFVFCKKFDYA
jgi:hypothetical protein